MLQEFYERWDKIEGRDYRVTEMNLKDVKVK